MITVLQLIVLCFTATPVGIIIPEIQGTMELLKETIHTENSPIPVPEMTMAQCQEDTGMSSYKRLKTEIGSHLVLK